MNADPYTWTSTKTVPFLKLTLCGRRILWVSVNKITAISDGVGCGANVYIDGDEPWRVIESPQEIMEALNK